MKIQTVGSVCSGIEAASVAWKPLGLEFKWFSEIANFPSQLLSETYPSVPNLGDLNNLPPLLKEGLIEAPDLICGGTPCQAFSLAGMKRGLTDERGNLTLKFIDIIEANDQQRNKQNLSQTIVFWENVEGVLSDKTNAFGCFISALAGLEEPLTAKRWPKAGLLKGPQRNIAWRVLDAKYFGVPQQRKRLYLLAEGTDFHPETILFETHQEPLAAYPASPLIFEKEGHQFEIFREYTDCLYAAYGTKWNGNAAAYNGSLFVAQNHRLRRLSPLEAERLMGFPDHYTNLEKAKRTQRYQAIGNSWAIPVIRWIGERLLTQTDEPMIDFLTWTPNLCFRGETYWGVLLKEGLIPLHETLTLNCTSVPETCHFQSLKEIVSTDAPDELYLSVAGCQGILRRSQSKGIKLNERLETVLKQTRLNPNEK